MRSSIRTIVVVGQPRTFPEGQCLLFFISLLYSSFAFPLIGHRHHIGSLNSNIDQTSQTTIDPSDETILKDIDREHYNDVHQLCSYLASEAITSADIEILQECDATTALHHSPAAPVLSDEAINALRTNAQSYFEKRRESNNGSWEMEMVDLGELLVSTEVDVGWKKELDDALTQNIYPLIRSGWPNHDGLYLPNSSIVHKRNIHPVLTVTSATVVAGGGGPGANATLTTLERDAGLFVVHIDLGNNGQIANSLLEDTPVMGALYLESLSANCEMPIVGPLLPGQMVVHRSIELTSAIAVPSDIHSLKQKNKSSLDSLSRRQILKAAESTRHYALRLVLTTKTESSDETDIPDAPSEERSYRLRTLSRLLDSRVRYLTLASEVDMNDGKNHFWLGFDYLAKVSPANQLGVHDQLSYIDKAVFHLEKAATLSPTDARVHFQLATTLKAKIEWEKRLLTEDTDGKLDSFESVYLTRMADALERSVQLESAAVRVCATGIQDLSVFLPMLAETRCKLGEFEEALDVIDTWAECGSLRSALAIEDTNHQIQSPIPSYKWIRTQGDKDSTKHILNRRDIALATVGDVRVFEPEDISLLRAAADKHFAQNAGQQTSRYTMQYEGKALYLSCPFFFNNYSLHFTSRFFPTIPHNRKL